MMEDQSKNNSNSNQRKVETDDSINLDEEIDHQLKKAKQRRDSDSFFDLATPEGSPMF